MSWPGVAAWAPVGGDHLGPVSAGSQAIIHCSCRAQRSGTGDLGPVDTAVTPLAGRRVLSVEGAGSLRSPKDETAAK